VWSQQIGQPLRSRETGKFPRAKINSTIRSFPRTLGSEAAANVIQINERIVIPRAKDEAGTDLEGIRLY
jgi:hypothetical protein